jgi:hypothetical protein
MPEWLQKFGVAPTDAQTNFLNVHDRLLLRHDPPVDDVKRAVHTYYKHPSMVRLWHDAVGQKAQDIANDKTPLHIRQSAFADVMRDDFDFPGT